MKKLIKGIFTNAMLVAVWAFVGLMVCSTGPLGIAVLAGILAYKISAYLKKGKKENK